MKFKVNRDHFSNALAQVVGIASTKASLPVLGLVLIEASVDGFVTLTTTNLDAGIRCKVRAEVTKSGGIAVPAKRLTSIVRELPNVEVNFEVVDGKQVRLSSGCSKFRILAIAAGDFPALPQAVDEKMVQLSQASLLGMLEHVSYAQSTDETRYNINAVYFEFSPGRLTLVATDGRRLAFDSCEVPAVAAGIPSQVAGKVILPLKTVAELMRHLGRGETVQVSFNEARVCFVIGQDPSRVDGLIDNIYFVSKVVDGTYPNYRQIIPTGVHQRIALERELFLQCVRRASLVCSGSTRNVKLKFSKHLVQVTASSGDFGEAREEMAISYDGPEMQIAFNPDFLVEPLKALTQDVIFIEIKDDNSAGVLKNSEAFLCILMPVRLH